MVDETTEERLNNDEFKELVPHLELEDLFITEIKNDKEWIKIFKDLNKNKGTIHCNLCKRKVGLESFKSHLKGERHNNAVKDVKQFYHPAYTYDKSSEKLALGEPVSEKEKAEGIKLAKTALDLQSNSIAEVKSLLKVVEWYQNKKVVTLQIIEITEIVCRSTHRYRLVMETKDEALRCNLCEMINPFFSLEGLNAHFRTMDHMERTRKLKQISLNGHPELDRNSIIQADIDSKYAIEYNKTMIGLLEKEKIEKTYMMGILCELELKDMLKLEYLKGKVWKPMLVTANKKESTLKCNLCNKTFNVSSTNSHVGGKPHKIEQLATEKLRHPSYKNISKNYIFLLGEKYVIKTSFKAKRRFHEKVVKILKEKSASEKNEKKKSNDSKENKSENVNKTKNEPEKKREDAHKKSLENEPQRETDTKRFENDPENDQDNEAEIESEEKKCNENVVAELDDAENDPEEKNDNENAEIIEIDETDETDDEREKQNMQAENLNDQEDENEPEQEINAVNLNEQEDEPEAEPEGQEDQLEEQEDEAEGQEDQAEGQEDQAEGQEDQPEGQENEPERQEDEKEGQEDEPEGQKTKAAKIGVQEDEPAKKKTEATISNKNGNVEKHNNSKSLKKELSSKIAAKVKALRDAKEKSGRKESRSKRPYDEISKKNHNAENITPENALIGVEYVVKIIKHPRDEEPKYECCLCEVLMNQSRMQNHLTGYNHRLKYCEMHYGNAFTKFSACLKGVKYIDMFRTMGPILGKLACEIEKVNGRSIPHAVSAAEFEADRARIIAKLYGEKHACQLFGPSFTNILSEADIQKILDDKDSFEAPKFDKNPNCRFKEFIHGQSYCGIKLKGERMVVFTNRAKSDRGVKERAPSRNIVEKPSRRIRDNLSPRRESSPSNVWQRYRREILLSASEIERDYKNYRNCPDSHPLYDLEWNKFWKARKDDLVSRGIDPRNHNFQKEWVPYFKDRMEQLFGEALEQAKLDVRIRLNIPLDAVEDRNFSVERSSRLDTQSRSERHFENVSTSTRREPPIKRSRVDTDNLVMHWNSQEKYARSTSQDYGQDPKVSHERFMDKERVEEKPDLVHVLRLMTAFEDYLGSLGPKITDLLFSTLTLEKQIPNDGNLLERKILTTNNCSLLETAMEKLKGTLLAGLLDSSKEPGLNRVIDCTTNLLTYADNMGYLKQFPPAQNIPQVHKNPQFSSNIQELMTIMTGVKDAGPSPNRLNAMEDFSGSNPYAPPNNGNQFSEFQQQQFGNNRSSSAGRPSKINMGMNSTEVLTAALRKRFNSGNNNIQNESFVQMPQRNMNMPGPGPRGNVSANMNMAGIGINNYNNSNLNNPIANNNDRNFPNKGNIQNTGPPTGYWKPFSGGNATGSLQQNSGGRMWQQNDGNSWQGVGAGSLPGHQQQNFRQQQTRQN